VTYSPNLKGSRSIPDSNSQLVEIEVNSLLAVSMHDARNYAGQTF